MNENYEDLEEENEDDPLLLDDSSNGQYGVVWSGSEQNSSNNYDSRTNSTEQKMIQVKLTRDATGFGMCLVGGKDNRVSFNDPRLYISSIVQHSPAHLSGMMDVGDQVVAVNKTDLENVTYREGLDAIRNSSKTAVFTIRKNINWE